VISRYNQHSPHTAQFDLLLGFAEPTNCSKASSAAVNFTQRLRSEYGYRKRQSEKTKAEGQAGQSGSVQVLSKPRESLG